MQSTKKKKRMNERRSSEWGRRATQQNKRNIYERYTQRERERKKSSLRNRKLFLEPLSIFKLTVDALWQILVHHLHTSLHLYIAFTKWYLKPPTHVCNKCIKFGPNATPPTHTPIHINVQLWSYRFFAHFSKLSCNRFRHCTRRINLSDFPFLWLMQFTPNRHTKIHSNVCKLYISLSDVSVS